MTSRRRFYCIVTTVFGTIILCTILIQVQFPYSSQSVIHIRRIFGDDSIKFVAPKVEECDDLLCKKYLTKSEWRGYKTCVKETLRPDNKLSEGQLIEQDPTPCTFYNGTAKKGGASLLVSFPGSGNTWLRGLLQQATGVCVGSTTCDMDLRRRGFPGEGICGPSVLLVKAHFKDLTNLKNIERTEDQITVVFLVRNPFNAIVAERTRAVSANISKYWNGTHVSSDIHEHHFGTNSSWVTFLTEEMDMWKSMVIAWLTVFKGPVMVVKYEDLLADVSSEVFRILDFVDFDYSEESVRSALVQDFSRFQRKKHGDFKHYTADQERTMLTMLDEVNAILARNNKTHLLSVEDYKTRP